MYSNFNVSSSLNFVLVKYEIQEQDNTIPIEDCFSGPPSKPCLESIPVCRSPMYFGVGPSAPWGPTPEYLAPAFNQICVEHFISNSADGHPCPL